MKFVLKIGLSIFSFVLCMLIDAQYKAKYLSVSVSVVCQAFASITCFQINSLKIYIIFSITNLIKLFTNLERFQLFSISLQLGIFMSGGGNINVYTLCNTQLKIKTSFIRLRSDVVLPHPLGPSPCTIVTGSLTCPIVSCTSIGRCIYLNFIGY